jgi:hypothetical protein
MSILKNLNLSRLILLILLSLVSISTFSLTGYCDDDWIYVDSYKNYTLYYKPSSVKIDKQNKIFEVWVKYVFTDEGKIDFLNIYDDNQKHKLINVKYMLNLFLVNYKDWKLCITHNTLYSTSDKVLNDSELSPIWSNIKPNSRFELLFNKILKDFMIQR